MTIDKLSFILDLWLSFIIWVSLTTLMLSSIIDRLALQAKDIASDYKETIAKYKEIEDGYVKSFDKADKILDSKNSKIKLQEKIINNLLSKLNK